jgi:hypothetical protein
MQSLMTMMYMVISLPVRTPMKLCEKEFEKLPVRRRGL